VTAPRKQAVDMLSQIFGLRQDIFVIGESMVEAINSYHIHFNMNIANDINYRSFETLACNTVLLTNYNYQYDSLGFVDGKNCFMYSDQRDLIAKTTQLIRMIEDSSLSLKRIAENGRELFLTKHTYDERAKEILNVLSKQ
jgi:spore maturation protein CgeB